MPATTVRLSVGEASSAEAIQQAIDALGPTGGHVVLPEMELTLDRGIALRSGVELVGQGRGTLLRQAPARIYPLSGYHNYGMHDAPLEHTDGLAPGMTVALRDRRHGGFFETLARLTWVEGTWVGLDRGLHSDYHADQAPELVTAYPLIYGEGVEHVAVRNLTLDGQRERQPAGIGACRGAAVYFVHSHHFEVSQVVGRGYAGEGLGFQMCHHGRISGCRFEDNAGNGYHPGAGSTAVAFEDCVAEGNDLAGFFFCVRANHITVRGCAFRGNRGAGVSVGTRDCHNLIADCHLEANDGPGLLLRAEPRPVEVQACLVRRCHIAGNARVTGRAQIDILGEAHDIVLEDNTICGGERESAGVYLAPSTQRIWLHGNTIARTFPEVVGAASQLALDRPVFDCGHEAAQPRHWRHLGF